MAFPPLPVDANVGGAISDPSEHPGHHNALAAAVNDIVEHVSTLEGGGGGGITSGERTFSIPGTLTTGSGSLRMYFTKAATVTNVWASVATAPTGASVIFDVNKNGTTIFSTQGNRPTIAISGFVDVTSTPDVTAVAAGDYVTVDVDQVGSTIAGANAVVGVEFTEVV